VWLKKHAQNPEVLRSATWQNPLCQQVLRVERRVAVALCITERNAAQQLSASQGRV
jgi:hypothetical protein